MIRTGEDLSTGRKIIKGVGGRWMEGYGTRGYDTDMGKI